MTFSWAQTHKKLHILCIRPFNRPFKSDVTTPWEVAKCYVWFKLYHKLFVAIAYLLLFTRHEHDMTSSYETHHEKTGLCICENKDTDQLISAFVFATWIVQSFFYLNPKFQAYNYILWLYSLVCVGPGLEPRRQVFSRRGSVIVMDTITVRPTFALSEPFLCASVIAKDPCWLAPFFQSDAMSIYRHLFYSLFFFNVTWGYTIIAVSSRNICF